MQFVTFTRDRDGHRIALQCCPTIRREHQDSAIVKEFEKAKLEMSWLALSMSFFSTHEKHLWTEANLLF